MKKMRFWVRSGSILVFLAGCNTNYHHPALDPKVPSSSRTPAISAGILANKTGDTEPSRPVVYSQMVWPVRGEVLYGFGDKKGRTYCRGVELLAMPGEPVHAACDGQVTFVSESLKGYGKAIVIDHGNGMETVYAFQSENAAAPGDRVKAGQVIAKAGCGGRAVSNSVHFEVRRNHMPVDPLTFLAKKEGL